MILLMATVAVLCASALGYIAHVMAGTIRHARTERFRNMAYPQDPWNVKLYWRYLSGTPGARKRRLELVGMVTGTVVFLGVPTILFGGATVASAYGVEDEYWDVVSKVFNLIAAFRK